MTIEFSCQWSTSFVLNIYYKITELHNPHKSPQILSIFFNGLSLKYIWHIGFLKLILKWVDCILFNFSEPPSKPRNLVAVEITHNSITLSWIPPVSDGGRKDVQYRITCSPCETVSFNPGWQNLNQTRYDTDMQQWIQSHYDPSI